ncbi:hypothetical protein HC931_10360 [Candidatus Gracilibacteria bacterium]|jgi:hypothetical protein|nr:hypothetical protein [Candidatus Gracilibacteria bacterium]NJM86971.1 hypothetical protein [Hydrococcus sp. RU_2_2]NJP18994.1 hypothetical protein [Hydrococcus sp. CRU_1_1]
MSKYTRMGSTFVGYLFVISLVLTLIIYIFRGLGILTFIPGGIILVLMALSLTTGIIYGISKMQRF